VNGVRVRADRDACIGAGNCVLSAADTFDQDDAGLVLLRLATPPPETEAAVREAANLCPSRAITVEAIESGDKV
jgi:ferredoxin